MVRIEAREGHAANEVGHPTLLDVIEQDFFRVVRRTHDRRLPEHVEFLFRDHFIDRRDTFEPGIVAGFVVRFAKPFRVTRRRVVQRTR